MSLRCSLLGHSYGDAEIEREREEQGSEVVVTVREFEECERCGDRKVVTENKEVTALETPARDINSAQEDGASGAAGGNAGSESGSDASAGVDSPSGPDAGVGRTGGGHDAEIITDSPSSGSNSDESDRNAAGASADDSGADAGSDTGAGDDAASDAEGTADPDVDSGPSAADDDGVILDDDGEESGDDGRTPGEWPEADTTHPAETDESGPTEWPDVGREDEGYDAEPDDGASADVEFGGGLTPESSGVAAGEDEEVEFVNAEGDTLQARDAGGSGPELSSGISAGAEAPSLSGPADDPDLDAEFVCPECDYRATVSGSSLRAGDICPECARGYLAQE